MARTEGDFPVWLGEDEERPRPIPTYLRAAARARAVLAKLSAQTDDPEAQAELANEIAELATYRRAATARLLGDG